MMLEIGVETGTHVVSHKPAWDAAAIRLKKSLIHKNLFIFKGMSHVSRAQQ